MIGKSTWITFRSPEEMQQLSAQREPHFPCFGPWEWNGKKTWLQYRIYVTKTEWHYGFSWNGD
jgi:hypothetical protein